MNNNWIDDCFERLDKKLSRTAVSSYDKLPYTTENGIHDDMKEKDRGWWTNGFWSALMTIMYAATKKEQYIKTARHSMDILDSELMNYDRLDHDVGFLWNITSGTDYRLTGDKKQRNRMMLAANHMMGRFNVGGGFFRAWNKSEAKGWCIIDCMMNLPVLYRASEELDDSRYAMAANIHADKAMQYHIRPDGSCNHINEYDPVTGEYIKSYTGQGCAEDSSWSRGQSWGLYGFALAYKHTKNEEYLNTAKRIAHYYIACTAKSGWLSKCDFRQPDGEELYDATACACAACGLLEIAGHVSEAEKPLYRDAAVNMLMALEKECDWSEEEDSILQKCTGAYAWGHHMPIIYGDYFFAEGIYRLKGFDTDILW